MGPIPPSAVHPSDYFSVCPQPAPLREHHRTAARRLRICDPKHDVVRGHQPHGRAARERNLGAGGRTGWREIVPAETDGAAVGPRGGCGGHSGGAVGRGREGKGKGMVEVEYPLPDGYISCW